MEHHHQHMACLLLQMCNHHQHMACLLLQVCNHHQHMVRLHQVVLFLLILRMPVPCQRLQLILPKVNQMLTESMILPTQLPCNNHQCTTHLIHPSLESHNTASSSE